MRGPPGSQQQGNPNMGQPHQHQHQMGPQGMMQQCCPPGQGGPPSGMQVPCGPSSGGPAPGGMMTGMPAGSPMMGVGPGSGPMMGNGRQGNMNNMPGGPMMQPGNMNISGSLIV